MPQQDSREPLALRLARFEQAADCAAPTIWISRGTVVAGDADASAPRPLAGKLFAAKDNIDVAGYPTTAGCPDFARRPEQSASIVQKLLHAGASLVGKTNLDQFACGLVGTRSPYGAVPNAFNPAYISGGSSSGSAVSVALGLVDFSLGTDTAGSGRVPAGFNNIVGLKPSRGLLSTAGILPACAHIDCPSIFTRSVAEAVEVLLCAAGVDSRDPWSRAISFDGRAFPARFRFGIPDAAHLQFFGDRQAEAAFAQACSLLGELGGEMQPIDYAPLADAATALYEDAWVAERYAAIRGYFDAHAQSIDPVVRGIIDKGRRYDAAQLFDAMQQMAAWRQQATSAMRDIDVLIVPTAPTIYTLQEIAEEPVTRNRNLGLYTNSVNLLDLAAIAVPSSMRADGLPFGITLIGPAGSELRLAELAARYHAATGLCLGVSQDPVPPARNFTAVAGGTIPVALVGAHMSGMPLNWQLTQRGAHQLSSTQTAPCYRLYELANTSPPKPGLVRVAQGASIDVEIWQMPLAAYGSFVSMIPAPLGIGSIELADGSFVQGFLCEGHALHDARDITEFGGWRAWLARSPAAAPLLPPSTAASLP